VDVFIVFGAAFSGGHKGLPYGSVAIMFRRARSPRPFVRPAVEPERGTSESLHGLIESLPEGIYPLHDLIYSSKYARGVGKCLCSENICPPGEGFCRCSAGRWPRSANRSGRSAGICACGAGKRPWAEGFRTPGARKRRKFRGAR
jgi:hypothetical protein